MSEQHDQSTNDVMPPSEAAATAYSESTLSIDDMRLREPEAHDLVDWDEGALATLETFLTLHTPYAATLPQDREPTEQEIQQALTRRGKPTWNEQDFQGLIRQLQYAGYGWLRPEGVRHKLEEMAASWQGPPPLPVHTDQAQADQQWYKPGWRRDILALVLTTGLYLIALWLFIRPVMSPVMAVVTIFGLPFVLGIASIVFSKRQGWSGLIDAFISGLAGGMICDLLVSRIQDSNPNIVEVTLIYTVLSLMGAFLYMRFKKSSTRQKRKL